MMQNDKSKFKIIENLKKKLSKVQEDVFLSKHTTFRIGGSAKYFFEAKTKKDLVQAIVTAKKLELKFFILGGGSNLLVNDKGFDGLIIKIQNSNLEIQNHNLKFKIVYIEAGTRVSDLIRLSLENPLAGLEWAAGIPGTIGGAIRGNAGAFGKEVKEIVKEVEVFDVGDEKIKTFNNKDCKFGYRDSIFKHNSNLIILSTKILLEKGDKGEVQEKIKKYLSYRRDKHPIDLPSAGSIFKNPKIEIKNKKLLKEFSELKTFNQKGEIPVGWLIEKCNLRGKRIGDVKISEKHSNFFVNLGKGRAGDVIKLINLAKGAVKKKFKIILEEEIQYLGF